MEKTEGTGEGNRTRERRDSYKSAGRKKKERVGGPFASAAASSDNTRRKREREREKYLRNSHINNYCYSVMTDVGHGKTR